MWFLQARCGLLFTIINHNQTEWPEPYGSRPVPHHVFYLFASNYHRSDHRVSNIKIQANVFSLTQLSFFSHFHASHPLPGCPPLPQTPALTETTTVAMPACEPVFTHPRVKFHWPQQLAGCAYYSFIIITNNQLGLLLKEKTPLLQGRIRLSEHWCLKSILYTLRSFVMLH